VHQIDLKLGKSRLHDIDRRLILSTIGLTLIGLVLIYSADHSQDVKTHFTRQIYFGLFGLVLLIATAALPPRIYYALAYVIYVVSLIGLMMVPVAGIIGLGARRWLVIGGINVQPSEPAKIAFVLAMARVLSYRGTPLSVWQVLGLTALISLPPTALVLLQPDLGTATVFPFLTVVMLAWFGLPLRVFILFLLPLISLFLLINPWIITPVLIVGLIILIKSGVKLFGISVTVALCIIATFAAPRAWDQLEPYQQKRLTTFLNPAAEPLGSGYQIIQSKVAVGSGGVTGRGFLRGTQTQLRFLPEQHTDFIFALAGEEFGFAGTTLIIILFLLYGWSAFSTARRTKSSFMGFVAVGLGSLVLYHAVVNIGMTLGVLPVTGLPLPFLSYGGSFLITCLACTGILLSIGMHRREL